ncbi:MAG: adenylate/guanylate cyclase domain-containing protein, partial [Acidiferrobacterales bacterium]
AAVLYADVAGYSRLTGEDEEGTHRLLSAYLDAVTAAIDRHNGKALHFAGDAVLADFGTVSDALTCSAEFQRDLEERNKDLPDDRKVQFRVGVNLGEVIVDRNEIYGDGVNVAARLESLAEPGGICISGTVYDAIGTRLQLAYQFLGEQSVKNIEKPVRAYRVLLDAGAASKSAPVKPATIDMSSQPSIAVLPFENRSGDPEQGYFADGITEDIITALSKFRWFSVIARNSMFSYKGTAANWKQVARDLGARYVLEGSVRKAGKRVRITAQLVDTTTGNHIWGENYDRALQDVFAVQDEITRHIAAAIEPELFAVEGQRVEKKSPGNLDAWDYFLRAQTHIYTGGQEDNLKAQELARQAIEVDPTSVHGYKALAWSIFLAGRHGWAEWRGEDMEAARNAAIKAISLDPKDAFSHQVMGGLHLAFGELDPAIQELETAIELNPCSPFAYSLLAACLAYDGRAQEGLRLIDVAEQISPRDPMLPYYRCSQGLTYWCLGEYPLAVECAKYAIQNTKKWLPSRYTLTASYEKLGRHDDAKKALDLVFEVVPDFSVTKLRSRAPYKNPADFENLANTLRKVGLPE